MLLGILGAFIIAYAGLNWVGVMIDWIDFSGDASAIQATQAYTQLIHWTLVGGFGAILMIAGFLIDKFQAYRTEVRQILIQLSTQVDTLGRR